MRPPTKGGIPDAIHKVIPLPEPVTPEQKRRAVYAVLSTLGKEGLCVLEALGLRPEDGRPGWVPARRTPIRRGIATRLGIRRARRVPS